MAVYVGRVRDDLECRDEYRNVRAADMPGFNLWPDDGRGWRDRHLLCFETGRTLVSAGFATIDVDRGIFFRNHSYTGLEGIIATRHRLAPDRTFRLESEPVRLPGRYVVIGGPIDGVWYHWLFSWFPRLLLLKTLRPDVLADPTTRFFVHPLALRDSFAAILRTIGIAPDRFVAAAPGTDYLLEAAVLVSFPDQNTLYPELVRSTADHLLATLAVTRTGRTSARLYVSRQPLPPPKRRVANFDVVRPILEKNGYAIATMGDKTARRQAQLFHDADVVVGGHGSDLSNLLFCRPGTRVLVFEHLESLRFNLHVGLEQLCGMLDLRYEHMPTAATTPPHGANLATLLHQDFVIDPEELDRRLTRLSA